jgi:heme/copper-type cytochrome/quinol oxidase subunit 1
MKNVWAILVWGVLIFAIGTYLDKVRKMLMGGGDPVVVVYALRFGLGLVLVVVAVLVGRWVRRLLKGGLEPGGWFVAGALAWVIEGGYGCWTDPRGTIDIQLHDTLYVIARLYAVGGVVILYLLIGLIYYQGRGMNRVVGYVHFFATHAALFVLLWMQYLNPAYQVRRYLEWHEFQQFQMVSEGYDVMAVVFVTAQLLFVVNLFLMLFSRGTRRAANGRFR